MVPVKKILRCPHTIQKTPIQNNQSNTARKIISTKVLVLRKHLLYIMPTHSRSSSSSSIEPDQDTPRPLYRIAFEGESTAHWALFLPFDGPPHTEITARGTLVHIGVQKAPGKSGTERGSHVERRALRIHKFNQSTSSKQRLDPIRVTAQGPIVQITERQLRKAATAVFDRPDYNYHALSNNCQHFCIHTVMELHKDLPRTVPITAVEDLRKKGTKLTTLTRLRDRLKDLTPDTSPNAPASGERFELD